MPGLLGAILVHSLVFLLVGLTFVLLLINRHTVRRQSLHLIMILLIIFLFGVFGGHAESLPKSILSVVLFAKFYLLLIVIFDKDNHSRFYENVVIIPTIIGFIMNLILPNFFCPYLGKNQVALLGSN